MVCTLHGYYDARPKMCFNLSPPPPTPNGIFSSNLTYKCSSDYLSAYIFDYHCQDYNNNNNNNNSKNNKIISFSKERNNMQRPEEAKNVNESKIDEETTSDYKQWLHAMKLVARLPGGIPPEFRRKLWLSLADKYLKSKNVNWPKEEEKCFCEKWGEDDEELGIQIVKDLHRTGSTLCTGPAGDLNQAKLKRILLGYARYNPEVGYCQGFNMLGALILQVMDKNESESIRVMIYLVEGILPEGYFCGSMGGLQADMGVFRELMQTKLPRLAKHLQKLQGPIENAYEPPLTNVFTMQWFLTMFCTCLPMSCVLRVWDLVLIEGSDVLLRTALALWSLLEERVLSTRSADDFYGKMGSFSSELLNGHLIDSNGLIEKVVQLGPIVDIQRLRNKHLNNITPVDRQQGLQLYFDDDEPDIDVDSRLAVATVWGIPWGRRGSQTQAKQAVENKERIALDISLLRKQYDKLRERQKQAQIILTTACSTAASRQNAVTAPLPVNQLLSGRTAIITNKGRRSGPPTGAIPPARKPSLPAVLHEKSLEMQLRRGETSLYWRNRKETGDMVRRDSLSWKEIKAERAAMISSGSIDELKSQKIRSGRLKKSDSSSYSEESEDNDNEVDDCEDASSTDTSFCDDELQPTASNKNPKDNSEDNLKPSSKSAYKSKKSTLKQRNQSANLRDIREKARPKSWAPSNSEIPFVLMTTDSACNSADENPEAANLSANDDKPIHHEIESLNWKSKFSSPVPDNDSIMSKIPFDQTETQNTITKENISVLSTTISLGSPNGKDDSVKTFDISNDGVTNEYFERVNNTERPTKLDLLYSLNEDENARDSFQIEDDKPAKRSSLYGNDKTVSNAKSIQCMDLLVDYSEKSSVACIEEAKTEISTFQPVENSSALPLSKEHNSFTNENLLKKHKSAAEKRRDPRRLTLTRSSTLDIEKRFEMFEKRLSMDVSNYKRFSKEIESSPDQSIFSTPHQNLNAKVNRINNVHNDTLSYGCMDRGKLSPKSFSVDRKIPSTADLEQRFEEIQQQLVRDRNRIINSPCDSENPDKQKSSPGSPESNLRTNSGHQKSKQLKKDDANEENENDENIREEKATSLQSNIEKKSSASSEHQDAIDSSSPTKKKSAQTVHDSEETVSNNNQLKNKKEPPDENRYEEDVVKGDSKSKSNSNSNNSEELQEDSKKNIKEEDLAAVVDREKRADSKRISDQDRSSPPSTEELEKRFCALEEKISSSKTESNELKQNKSKETPIQDQEEEEKTESGSPINIVSRDQQLIKTNFNKFNESTKRRLSEPPSTEDLEKRYEILKRRMSSRNFETRTTLYNDGLNGKISNKNPQDKASPHLGKDVSAQQSLKKHSPPSIENLEERFEKLQNKTEPKTPIEQSVTSAENLEEHFEENQNKNECKTETITKSTPFTENSEESFETKEDVKKSNRSAITKKSPLKDDLEERREKSQNEDKPTNSVNNKKSPPSAEDLEERYEKLHHQNESKRSTITKSPPSVENLEERFEKLHSGKHDSEKNKQDLDAKGQEMSKDQHKNNKLEDKNSSNNESESKRDSKTAPAAQEVTDDKSDQKISINPLSKNVNKIKIKLIEELQAKIKEHSVHANQDEGVERKMALIKELKTKIDPRSDKIGLKPTQVSSRRPNPSINTLLPSLSFNDETLESHATSAYCKSGKYEPANTSNRKMVRRFSDLPSRADLENRLQFLEEQLSKTLCMQRRSGDSEVPSSSKSRPPHNKSTIPNIPLSASLEYRVQELEKRLNNNKAFSMSEERDSHIEIAQVELAADSVPVTGKELVRYSSRGEILDTEHQNPINISINIQMTLNKDDIGHDTRMTTDISKTDNIDKRLKFLEQKMETTHGQVDLKSDTDTDNLNKIETKENLNKTDSEFDDLDKTLNKSSQEINTRKLSNEDVKSPQKPISQLHNKSPSCEENKSLQAINQVSVEDEDAPKSSESNIVIEKSEMAQKKPPEEQNKEESNTNENEKEKDPVAENFSSSKKDNSTQSPETDTQMENVKSTESRSKDSAQEDKNFKETQTVEEKVEKERKISEPTSTTAESVQKNSNQEPCQKVSSQQNSQSEDTQTNCPQEVVLSSQEHSTTQPNPKAVEMKASELNDQRNTKEDDVKETGNNIETEKLIIGSHHCSQIVPVEVNKKTLVLLLDNEPKAVKVRRLTRANTEELEGLFQALEQQLNDRGQQKIICDKETLNTTMKANQNEIEASQAMSNLAKEIEAFSKTESNKTEQKERENENEKEMEKEKEKEKETRTQTKQKKPIEEFDWGSDPIKYHLKKRTVYLPSTKELEARFRSLERQIKLLEDVEKIDVEQRLTEIERKIKLQYSLSHEKDLNKFLELCEGKDPDDIYPTMENEPEQRENCSAGQVDHKCCTAKQSSPSRLKDSNLEAHYRSLELKRSKSTKQSIKKQPIHPLEMLLDPSPEDSDIPTTGELEHRMRVMEESRSSRSSPSHKSRSVSPPSNQKKTKANTHSIEKLTESPTERGLPTAEELEARLEALEREHCFDFKTQKNFKQFNQKLKDAISPSLSFDEFKSSPKSTESIHPTIQATSSVPKQSKSNITTSPKAIRFRDREQSHHHDEVQSMKAIPKDKGIQQNPIVQEGLGVMGIRLMRETSPLRRKGTHTGIPLRTGENINDQLTSIQNTIKSIDSLCEEKPYRKERCQQYIDALFSDSTYFSHKKTSLEDLTLRNLSRSTSRERGPSIRISDHSPAFPRSMGSADSIQSSSPLRSTSPLQYRSNRDLRREPSPRRRRDEDREEHESRIVN